MTATAGAAPSWSLLRIDLSSPSAFADGEVNPDAVLTIRGIIVGFGAQTSARSTTSPFLDPFFQPQGKPGA